jgi:nucleotide-binding universal stress UspA family protein
MSELYKKILLATDGSEQNKKAVIHAIEQAKISRAELHAVYVLDMKTDYEPESYISTDLSNVEDVAKKEGINVKKWIVKGHPAEEILKLAKEKDADLIVMGSLGRSGIKKILLGSVADKVIRNSNIPVLIVRK